MKIKTQNKIYIISAVFVLFILALALFLALPVFNDIKKGSAQLLSAKQDIRSLQNEAAALENFQKRYREYQPNLEKIDGMFIDLKTPVDFIQFLEKTSSDLEISSQISMPPRGQLQNTGEKWPFAIFQINFKGNFAKILELSKKLESSPYLIEIQDLSLKEAKSGTAKAGLSSEFNAIFLIKVFAK